MLFYRLLGRLPLAVLYRLAWLGYLLLYYVAGYRQAVVRDNLRAAFPEKSAGEITALAKRFYRQLADTGVEIIRAGAMRREEFGERVTLLNPELLRRYSNDLRDSDIILTIHQGNWEWMLHGASAALGVPLDPVYKPLHNAALDRYIFEVRSRFGSRPLPMDQAARDILRRRREFRLFVMVADQSPIRRERSYWTRFLHRDAAFYLGAETIAKVTGFPVLFAQCRRPRRGHYEVEFHELAQPPHAADGHEITERYVRLAERAIRAEPHSWLWSNRRWKRQPPADQPRQQRC